MSKYSQFRVAHNEPVVKLISCEVGILSLTATSLRLHTHGGLARASSPEGLEIMGPDGVALDDEALQSLLGQEVEPELTCAALMKVS